MDQRQTLAATVEMRGIGLHSGEPVRLRLLPARPESGIVFVRTDAGDVEIPATLDHGAPSFYATVLEREGVRVSTVEHLLAALYALRVDDVRVELDADEPPILDGSSRPFVDAILAAGRKDSGVERRYITLTRSIEVVDGDKRISAHPAGEFRVTYAIEFDHAMLGYQELSVSLWNEEAFARKLAPARTFTFEKEVDALRQHGLALGGSLDNALVLGEERLLNEELRFPDEFVRHKILDLTGDLALLERPLLAHVVAYRGGHDLHGKLARKIARAATSWHLSGRSGVGPGLHPAAEG